jgi:hypothetical protein
VNPSSPVRLRLLSAFIAALASTLLLLALSGASKAHAEFQPVGVPGQWVEIFGDEFEAGKPINTAIWTPEWAPGISNRCVLRENASQSEGVMHLKVRPWNSACQVNTKDASGSAIASNPNDGVPGHTGFSYLYGYVEWRAYVPGWENDSKCGASQPGCIFNLPQLWSFSAHGQKYNGVHEFDVMEGLPRTDSEAGRACFHYHLWDAAYGDPQQGGCAAGTKNYAGWHTFGLDWQPNQPLKYYYDGELVGTISPIALQAVPQYLIASNLSPGHGSSVVNAVPADLKIDWVRVWQHSKPIVSTNAADEITTTSARLSGWVNPRGAATTYSFEWGKDLYENAIPVPEGSVGSGTSSVFAWNVLNGLQPGTTYHYRIVASNVSGTAYGSDQTFTTPGPPVIDVQPPGEVTQSKVAMAAKIDGRGYATTYYMDYGFTAGYGSKTEEKALPSGAGFQAVSAAVEGLEVGRTIHYRVVAKSSAGTTTGPDQVVTTAWSNEPSSGPAGSTRDELNDVSCPAPGSCIAVGSYIDSASGRTLASAARWSGTSWTPILPSSPAGSVAVLEGVSCTSAANCIAVGSTRSEQSIRPLIMKWNGSAWSEISPGSQLPAGRQSVLNDVSCPTATSCEAVGSSFALTGAERATLAMHFDGSAWTVRQSANPLTPGGQPAQEANTLESVSCAGATFCKAVGSHLSSIGGATSSKPLIESLSGSGWASEAPYTANFTDPAFEFWLQGVSCPTTGACLAVGHLRFEGETRAFTQRWTGSQWVGEGVRSEANQATELFDVSCSSPTSCRAVGADGRGLHWAGGAWDLQAPKPPVDRAAGTPLTLKGVACPTSTECHAVGSYTSTAGGQSRLTQGWSGAGAVPGATTSDTVFITETTAIPRGVINPAGVDASYYFEYGPTTAYGTKTPTTVSGSYNAGPGGPWIEVGAQLSGLTAGRTYHYRVVATNGAATATGTDKTFQTKNGLAEMPVTEPFNATTNAVSDFASKWAPLPWTSTRKGKDNANGYGPADTAANGAYFIPPVNDAGAGIAAQATIATGPGIGGRVSLWLNLINPSTSKTGFELGLQETAASTYTLTLKSWVNATETVLASQTGYPLAPGSQVALVDEGPAVGVYANTGSGFVKALTANTTTFSGGSAAVEVAGSTATRLTNFKVGSKAEKQASFEAALKSIPLADDLSRDSSPLSGSWSALPWATAAVKAGKTVTNTGWTPADSAIAGAYWLKQLASDTGTGDAVIATNNSSQYSLSPAYSGLWLNAPNPASARSGYQLRVVGTGYGAYEFQLVKWVNGTPTLLGTKTEGFPLGLPGVKFALVDKGGTVSVWSNPGNGTAQAYTQVLTAADSTYSYGYAGIEGSGSSWGMRDFRLGQLPLS